MGDDADAPHDAEFVVNGLSVKAVAKVIREKHYLASIGGGKATWILRAGTEQGEPLAVLAQQWIEPKYLVSDSAVLTSFLGEHERLNVFVQYEAQADSNAVFQALRDGKPLPSRYDFPVRRNFVRERLPWILFAVVMAGMLTLLAIALTAKS